MADTFFSISYVGKVLDQRGGCEMQFNHFAESYKAALYCETPAKARTGIQGQFQIVERHGNIALVQCTMPDGWSNNWKQGHAPGRIQDLETIIAMNPDDARAQAAALQAKAKTFIDKLGIPAAASELQRAINWLHALDLSGHHAGFVTVRDSYVNTLEDATGDGFNQHWMFHYPIHDSTVVNAFPVNSAVVLAMYDEMHAHAATAPCNTMHYGWLYGRLCTFLDAPVT